MRTIKEIVTEAINVTKGDLGHLPLGNEVTVADTAVRLALEEAAKAVCPLCGGHEAIGLYARPAREHEGKLVHDLVRKSDGVHMWLRDCTAGPIRSMISPGANAPKTTSESSPTEGEANE